MNMLELMEFISYSLTVFLLGIKFGENRSKNQNDR